MAKHIIKGWVTHTHYAWQKPEEATIGFTHFIEPPEVYSHDEYTVGIQQHSFEIEVPDNFNPNPFKVAGLKAKIEKVKVAAFEEIMKMEQEINKLLALQYEAPDATAVFEDIPDSVIDLNENRDGELA